MDAFALLIALACLAATWVMYVRLGRRIDSHNAALAAISLSVRESVLQFYENLAIESAKAILASRSDSTRQTILMQRFIAGSLIPEEIVEFRSIMQSVVASGANADKFAAAIVLQALSSRELLS